MDIFNKKKVKYLEEQIHLYSKKEMNLEAIVKYLVEEPDSNISKELKKLLTEKYSKNMWGRLTREAHLGYRYNKEYTENLAKQLIEFI